MCAGALHAGSVLNPIAGASLRRIRRIYFSLAEPRLLPTCHRTYPRGPKGEPCLLTSLQAWGDPYTARERHPSSVLLNPMGSLEQNARTSANWLVSAVRSSPGP